MYRSLCAPVVAGWLMLGVMGCSESTGVQGPNGAPSAAQPRTPAPANYAAPASPAAGADVAIAKPQQSVGLQAFNTEAYDHVVDNPFLAALTNPLSTFSIDVDTASYANVRRFLSQGQLPPPGAVRIEELVNYFTYDYPQPVSDAPFSVHVEVAGCPWNADHKLARIGLRGREIQFDQRTASNLVFLLDVSGSMRDANKLPLVKSAMKLLVEQLDENDRIAVVVYASASGLVLPSTSAHRKPEILAALERLQAGGSTNGGEGIQLAYDLALQNFIPGGVNRVILCTDGDFNVGVTNQSELVPLIEDRARGGVFLSVLGFGQGNLKDSTMEKLADRGNGNYAYIDTLREAKKVLVQQISGTLITIAKDVKIQIDFNPARVQAYRLLGYENRMLRAEDFQDDRKDAGEIGAGHTVTALYEIVPAGMVAAPARVEPSKYRQPVNLAGVADSDELLTVRLRYKQPDEEQSAELEVPVVDADGPFAAASTDLQFAAAVAAFGMLLRDSDHKAAATYEQVIAIASENLGDDREGYRREFVQLVRQAGRLQNEDIALHAGSR